MKSRGNSDGIGTEKQHGRKRFSGEVYLERDSVARKRDEQRRWLRGRQGGVDVGGGHGGFSSGLQLRRWPPPLFNQNFVDRFAVIFTYESDFGSNNKREWRREKVKKRIRGGPPLIQSTAFAPFPISPSDSGRRREASAQNS
ncbi:hypothetical protein Q3G72_025388 [Acer saccharum]|nr:hypothetical protein Q3G72_025388 [Acer saccharum]